MLDLNQKDPNKHPLNFDMMQNKEKNPYLEPKLPPLWGLLGVVDVAIFIDVYIWPGLVTYKGSTVHTINLQSLFEGILTTTW